jgi:RNA 2',3'-cyclic 3'-phosphodiesterase
MDNLGPTQFDSPLNRRERVFLGIGPAPPEWAEHLRIWINLVERRFPNMNLDIRWTALENLHLTLRFFGSVSQEEVITVFEKIDVVAKLNHSFILISENLELFPNCQHPRIAAIGLKDISGNLQQLESDIRQASAQIGQPPENRPFRPHVTFGRIATPNPRISQILSVIDLPKFPAWPVNEIVLFKSELQKGGSVYTPLKRFPLGDACVSGGDL